MRGPFELLADLYDYHYNYYRLYLHRRIIFSDYSWKQFQNDLKFNILRNKDYENVGELLKQTTLFGAASGLGLASFKYAIMTDFDKIPARKSLPVAMSVVLVGSIIGFTYGAVVNASAKYRGNKDGGVNHAIAALVAFPLMGVYARKNKLYWGIWSSVWIAGAMAVFKQAATGKLLPGRSIDTVPDTWHSNLSATHWRP